MSHCAAASRMSNGWRGSQPQHQEGCRQRSVSHRQEPERLPPDAIEMHRPKRPEEFDSENAPVREDVDCDVERPPE